MSAKYTPGPWFNNDGFVNGRDSRERFEGSVSIDIFDATEWPSELHEEALANAALIAAAPAMAEALESLLNASDIVDVSDDELRKIHDWGGRFGLSVLCTHLLNARAALRLAKGE